MASAKAQIAKDKGNNAFKAGNWAEAIGCYSEAIIADRTNPTFPLNRAAAYLKLSKYQDAERDCTTVLSIDPKNVKAFFRRAQARLALELYAEAEEDLLDALKLEPSNDSIKAELSSVRNEIAKSDKRAKSKSSKQVPVTLPPVASTSQRPLTEKPKKRRIRNVPIEIIEPDEEMAPTNGGTSSEKLQSTSPLPPPQRNADLLTEVRSRTLSSSSEVPAVSTSSMPSPNAASSPSTSQIPPSKSPKPAPRVGAGVFHRDGKFTIIRSPNSTEPTSFQDIPQTHFVFARRWNGLKTSQERFNLILLISPESLPALFKNNLAPELLMSILQTFLAVSSASPDHNALILSYMSNIPLISRFDTVLLFFSAKEKEIVKMLWNNIDPGCTSEYRVLWKV